MANQLVTKRHIQQGIVQYALLTIGILVIGGYFGYQHYTEYQAATTAFNVGSEKLNELKGVADKAKKDYDVLKKDMDKANSGVNESVEKILPSTENFTDLARELDKYFINTNATDSPMFLSDLRFNSPRFDTEDFATLPFSMNISGDENGLKEFLNYVETSGDLNDRSRLISIANITLSYQTPDVVEITSSDGSFTPVPTMFNAARMVTSSMSLNAYFQKPVESSTPAN